MLYDAERGDMTIAVVGDAMISRRMRAFRELHFLKLVEIIQKADVSIANLEFLFHANCLGDSQRRGQRQESNNDTGDYFCELRVAV